MIITGGNSIQRTYYEILSVREDSNYHEIRAGYKSALLNTHPDKLKLQNCPNPSGSDLDQLEFLTVQKAWEILSNSQSRVRYDKELNALRRKIEVVANEIRLGDMNFSSGDGDIYEFLYPCRCGDYFCINSVELSEMGILLGDNGELEVQSLDFTPVFVLPCGSCSLKVQLVVDKNF